MSGVQGGNGCSIIRASLPFANIGVLRAVRAQPLYLLTPAGRFALRATAHRADASLRCAAGRFALRATAHWADASLRALPGFGAAPQVLCRSTECKRFERPEVARNADGCSLYVFDLNLWRAGRVPKGMRRAAVAGRDGRARPAGRDSPEGAGARRWLDAQACGGGARSAGPVAGYGLPGTTRRARLAGRGARDGTCRAGARRRLAARGRGGGSRSAGPVAGASAGASVGSSAGASAGRTPCSPDALRDPGRYRGEVSG